MRIVTFLFAAVVALSALPATSYADCTFIGYVIRVQASGTASNNDVIYFRTGGFSTFYYWAGNQKPNVTATASAAVASQSKVFAVGDAASCPGSGNARFIGKVKSLIINP